MTSPAPKPNAVKFRPVGAAFRLWESPTDDWLQYGLPAEEYAQRNDLPWELSKSLFKDIYDFGPNGENVRLAAEELTRIIPILYAANRYFIEDALTSSDPFELVEIPRRVDDRIAERSEKVAYDVDDWTGDAVYALLGMIAIDGFIMGDRTKWNKYEEKYQLLIDAFALDGNVLRWRDPNKATA